MTGFKTGYAVEVLRSIFILIPFFLVVSTLLTVSEELENGVVTGKHFWFYGNIWIVSFFSFVTIVVSQHKLKFSLLDGLVFLFGITSFFFGYYVHNSIAITKQVLSVLVTVLYFNFRTVILADRLVF